MAEDIKNTAASSASEAQAPKAKAAKKGKRIVNSGAVHIQATFNNTIISVTDKTGAVLSASSAGANGFRGSKKGTAFAAGVAAEKALEIATLSLNIKDCISSKISFLLSSPLSIYAKGESDIDTPSTG